MAMTSTITTAIRAAAGTSTSMRLIMIMTAILTKATVSTTITTAIRAAVATSLHMRSLMIMKATTITMETHAAAVMTIHMTTDTTITTMARAAAATTTPTKAITTNRSNAVR